MNKKPGVRPGDIVAIPLDKEMFAVGIVLHVSTLFKNAMMIGFYKMLFTSMQDISTEKLGGEFIETPNYAGIQMIREGIWKVIGHSSNLLEEATVPELRVAYTLYYKDQALRRLSADELRRYPALVGQGGQAVENDLREYFLANSSDVTAP